MLFLQGHPSFFWRDLARALADDGHRILKVNFCLSDHFFWRLRGAKSYRGTLKKWPEWLTDFCKREGVSDILYFADQFPYHRIARDVADNLNMQSWACEFGYLRPDWLTLEHGGMGAASSFPRDPEKILALAERMPEPDMKMRWSHPFVTEACYDICNNIFPIIGRPLYPFYHSDRMVWPPLEYLSWLSRLLRGRHEKRTASELEVRLAESGENFNLVAMQKRDDYQIRASSHYVGLEDFLSEVFQSFVQHAPKKRRLLIKLHPLESDLPRWQKRIPKLARKYGIADRTDVIRGGNLNRLIEMSDGVILVNSTVGPHALALNTPVCALGTAIYDLPGLTHQSGLDTFWTTPDPVDRDFFHAFRRALMSIQVKGSFFCPDGRKEAIAEICRRFRKNDPQTSS